MNSFFKIFFASLLSLIVFGVLSILVFSAILSSMATKSEERTGNNAVLVLDLSSPFPEVAEENPFAALSGGENYDIPSVYDVVRMLRSSISDSSVKGLFLKCGSNANGFGTSEDIRNAIMEFRKSGKFVIAHADVITQGGYYVANAADKVYINPVGGLDWRGYSMNLFFMKGTLEKLEIEPQIFYAGKFKSATEPFREYKMTDANRLQSSELLKDLYGHFLDLTSKARNIDTALLHQYANDNSVRSANDALKLGLVDGLKYDDEVKEEIKNRLKIGKYDKLNFVSIAKYAKATSFKKMGKEKIAVIYAQGDIIDGKGEREQIGSESYVKMIRSVRLDRSIKAIVFRINSGGGSAMASENIWRELSLAKKEKPVVISFGDVSASGGYYLSCVADSIFAQPNTITGSIGVFSMLPNMQKFFNNKLGVTFDGVKTGPDADALSVSKPLTESQRKWIQNDVDSIYFTFTSRVAEGRKKDRAYIDSIGQGRVWSGKRGIELGLVDRIGGLQEAIDCAVRMAKTPDYRLKELPEPLNIFESLLGTYQQNAAQQSIRNEIGPEGMKTFQSLKKIQTLMKGPQARMPFDFVIE